MFLEVYVKVMFHKNPRLEFFDKSKSIKRFIFSHFYFARKSFSFT